MNDRTRTGQHFGEGIGILIVRGNEKDLGVHTALHTLYFTFKVKLFSSRKVQPLGKTLITI
jgi:hypothetical protein